jgi:hypothetical protein
VIAELRQVLSDSGSDGEVLSLERALHEFGADEWRVPTNKRALLATRFFLADLVWATTQYMLSEQLTGGITNYTHLLHRLLRWVGEDIKGRAVVVVSFNYDLLFEEAMRAQLGHRLDMYTYLGNPNLVLLKPHGSVNWMWPIADKMSVAGDALNRGTRVVADWESAIEDRREIETSSNPTFGPSSMHLSPLVVPAMALPVAKKSDFCWPRDQAEVFESLQGRVTRLMTIGRRGMEPHFTTLLRSKVKRNARALVVAGGRDGESEALRIMERLATQTDAARHGWDVYGDGFASLVQRRGRLDEFLTA